MRIGFIPSNDNYVHEASEPCEPYEEWLAREAAEARELNAALKDAYHALLEDVRKYAVQLELITAVVLNSNCFETSQERLDASPLAQSRAATARDMYATRARPPAARQSFPRLSLIVPAILFVCLLTGFALAFGNQLLLGAPVAAVENPIIMLATFERELPCGRETNFG